MDRRSALGARYDWMVAQMGVDPALYPLRFERGDDGSAHVEPQADGTWLRQVTELGRVTDKAFYNDDDALLYRLVCDVAGAEGSRWQAQQPRDGKDPRRADFARRLELVGKVSPAWRIRLAEELAQWLARHPYTDRALEPDQAKRAPRGLPGLLIIALVATGWAAAHVPLWQVWTRQSRLEREGYAVRAEVIARDQTHGKYADEYFLTYRYQGATRHLTGRESVDWTTYRRTEPDGSTVSVLYDPANQTESMVEGNDRAGRLLWIYAAIDGLLALVILWNWRNVRRGAATG